MKNLWLIDEADVQKVKQFVALHFFNYFVQRREERNVQHQRPEPTIDIFWKWMVSCLLTTQQRSGPNSAISKFCAIRPFPLDFDTCSSQNNLSSFVAKTLTDFGGIRRTETIGSELDANIRLFNSNNWTEIEKQLKPLLGDATPEQERAVAAFLRNRLKGFGPKQSRNLLQCMGLTRFEIPLDSRVMDWMNKDFHFPVKLSAGGLSDPDYYDFVMAGIQALCRKAGEYPCMLDAAIFASVDKTEWTNDNLRFF